MGFGLAPGRGTAVVNQTPAAPGFGPAGVHPQALGPSWAARSACTRETQLCIGSYTAPMLSDPRITLDFPQPYRAATMMAK